MSVSVNGPKTPLTKGSNGIATATLPNICKMPGPPAPFVPAPLPNIGKTGDKPEGYSKKVKIENKAVAIKGASFGSIGDMASKGTGGGMLSANTHGPCKFISPGSMDVKFEGGNVHLLTDMVTNNGGPSGSPANAATMMGAIQTSGVVYIVKEGKCPICNKDHEDFKESPDTKIDASTLVTSYIPNRRIRKHKKGTMIGVVHCKQGHKHAGRTNDDPKFIDVAHRSYHLTPQPKFPLRGVSHQDDTVGSMVHILRSSSSFRMVVQLAGILEKTRAARGEQVSRNPLGSCAAQKALVSTLLHGCTPSAMTEKWSRHAGDVGGDVGPIRHINIAGQLVSGREEGTMFGHQASVPPCETCNLLLPFLTCQEKEPCEEVYVEGCPHCAN